MDAETERQIRLALAAVDDVRIDTAFERATRNRSVTRVLEDGTVDVVPGARQATGVASLGTSEVAIAHKLSGTPAFVAVTPRASIRVSALPAASKVRITRPRSGPLSCAGSPR